MLTMMGVVYDLLQPKTISKFNSLPDELVLKTFQTLSVTDLFNMHNFTDERLSRLAADVIQRSNYTLNISYSSWSKIQDEIKKLAPQSSTQTSTEKLTKEEAFVFSMIKARLKNNSLETLKVNTKTSECKIDNATLYELKLIPYKIDISNQDLTCAKNSMGFVGKEIGDLLDNRMALIQNNNVSPLNVNINFRYNHPSFNMSDAADYLVYFLPTKVTCDVSNSSRKLATYSNLQNDNSEVIINLQKNTQFKAHGINYNLYIPCFYDVPWSKDTIHNLCDRIGIENSQINIEGYEINLDNIECKQRLNAMSQDKNDFDLSGKKVYIKSIINSDNPNNVDLITPTIEKLAHIGVKDIDVNCHLHNFDLDKFIDNNTDKEMKVRFNIEPRQTNDLEKTKSDTEKHLIDKICKQYKIHKGLKEIEQVKLCCNVVLNTNGSGQCIYRFFGVKKNC